MLGTKQRQFKLIEHSSGGVTASVGGSGVAEASTSGKPASLVGDELYSKANFLVDDSGTQIYKCRSYMLDNNGNKIVDPSTNQNKFQFDLSNPFKCPFSPDAKCVFADKMFNEDDDTTHNLMTLLADKDEAVRNRIVMKQNYVSCVNSDSDGNILITNATNPTNVKVYEYSVTVPHHKDPNMTDKRTYIVNPSQCGLMDFSEMITPNPDNTDAILNKLYFTGTKSTKPTFIDVTDDYLYNGLQMINTNDQANGKLYSEICSRAGSGNNAMNPSIKLNL
jgi:hypothetical protein